MIDLGHQTIGIFKGFHQAKKHDDPTQNGKLSIGIEIVKKGKFGDESSVEEFTIPQPLVDSGLPPRLQRFEQKIVRIPFEIRQWSMGNRSGVSLVVTARIMEWLDSSTFEVKPEKTASGS